MTNPLQRCITRCIARNPNHDAPGKKRGFTMIISALRLRKKIACSTPQTFLWIDNRERWTDISHAGDFGRWSRISSLCFLVFKHASEVELCFLNLSCFVPDHCISRVIHSSVTLQFWIPQNSERKLERESTSAFNAQPTDLPTRTRNRRQEAEN